ncbi:MAG: heparinase II/III family protein, partial [Litorimonas sp.]
PMVATLRHTDGGLGLFHGGHAEDSARVAALLGGRGTTPNRAPQAFAFGPHTGYHRLEAGGTVALVDTGGVAPRPYDLGAHLAPLSVEISTQDGRMMTNCGWHPGAAPDWRRPVRASAAHSTLTVADRSPGDILEGGFMGDALGAAVSEEPDNVQARRKEQSSGIWLESSHDGYKDAHGLVHRRRLFLGETGEDIRGEDSLFVPVGDVPVSRDSVPFALRFHFHPDIRVSLAQDLSSALLVQKGQSGWRFRTDSGPLVVEPSVYLGESAKPVRCHQLVIGGRALCDGDGQGRENRVRWSLRRLRGREQ